MSAYITNWLNIPIQVRANFVDHFYIADITEFNKKRKAAFAEYNAILENDYHTLHFRSEADYHWFLLRFT